ncbi:hypothetical protein D3C84_342070 [compost metagenome]
MNFSTSHPLVVLLIAFFPQHQAIRIDDVVKQSQPVRLVEIIALGYTCGPKRVLGKSHRVQSLVDFLQQRDFCFSGQRRCNHGRHFLYQPKHTQVVFLRPLDTGLRRLHHAQHIAHAASAADQQKGFAKHPLQQFAAVFLA